MTLDVVRKDTMSRSGSDEREGHIVQRGFRLRLVATTVSMIWTFVVLFMGVLVVATDSGRACGFDWPYCQGSLFPNVHDVQQVIEYTHRLLTGLLGFVILGSALLILFWRDRPTALRHTRTLAVMSVVLLVAQALIGGLNVLLGTPKGFTTLDVMVSSLLWISVVTLWGKLYVSRYNATRTPVRVQGSTSSKVQLENMKAHTNASTYKPTRLGQAFLIFFFGDLLLGAFFKHSALAEVLFGLNPERVWLTSLRLGEAVYVVHGVWGVTLFLMVIAWWVKSNTTMRPVLNVIILLLILETIVGMGAVASGLGVWMVAFHTLLATITLGVSTFALVYEDEMKGVRR